MATIVSNRASARRKLSEKPRTPKVVSVRDENDLRIATTAELLREVHLTRPDGTRCFDEQTSAKPEQAWRPLRAAVEADGDETLVVTARRAERRDGRPAASVARRGPTPSYHSEELCTSVLRTDWSSSAVQLAVDWSQPNLRCDLVAGRDRLAMGEFAPQAWLDGRRLTPVGSWEEVCWDTDDDADYLELEIALGHGIRMQRQFLLTRTDGLLFIADALLSSAPGDLRLEVAVPTASATKFEPADETREGYLTIGRRKRLVVPAALPEWRSDQHGGELVAGAGRLALRQSARQAVALYAPLCFIVDPRRAARPATWRRLTIGENLQIQPADRAVGYRLQVGREQWLVYRSLTPRANRTVLGVNLQTNFLCARFRADGEIERLMEIED